MSTILKVNRLCVYRMSVVQLLHLDSILGGKTKSILVLKVIYTCNKANKIDIIM